MRYVVPGVRPFRHELGTCLFSVFGTLLLHRGGNVGLSLGAGWDFTYPRAGIAAEEYYVPTIGESVAEAVLVEQGVTSEWSWTDDADEGWRRWRDRVLTGEPAVLAVDNYHLPFRPAFHDVHTNHLLVAYGVDDDAEVAFVLDATPPRYQGPVSSVALRAACNSGNPRAGDRDLFFTGSPIRNRQLIVSFSDAPWTPSAAWVRAVIGRNLHRLLAPPVTPGVCRGIEGMYEVAKHVESAGDRRACDDLFVFSGSVLSQRALHAVFLREAARRIGRHELLAHARSMDAIAHQWAALRVLTSREVRERPESAYHRTAERLRRIAEAERVAARRLAAMDEWATPQ